MLTICFVYQKGEIAKKAVILLKSIRKFNKDYNIFIGIPMPFHIYGEINNEDIEFMKKEYNVHIIYFENSISHSYKIGNKIQLFYEVSKMCSDTNILFLDSDIIQVNSFHIIPSMLDNDISVKLADLKTYTFDNYLKGKYNLKPQKNTYLSTHSKEDLLFPYCNAGFIFLSKSGLTKNFAFYWLNIAKEIYSDSNVSNKFPWLDQIALTITIQKLNMTINLLPETYNFPFHLKSKIPSDTIFCHYHSFDRLNILKSQINL